MRSVAANGADRATVAHGNCCFILSQMAVVVSEKREGPAQSTLKQKDQSIKDAPKGSAHRGDETPPLAPLFPTTISGLHAGFIL